MPDAGRRGGSKWPSEGMAGGEHGSSRSRHGKEVTMSIVAILIVIILVLLVLYLLRRVF